jgi:hypothetical protein
VEDILFIFAGLLGPGTITFDPTFGIGFILGESVFLVKCLDWNGIFWCSECEHSRFSSLYDAIHGWMMRRMDGSRDEKSFTKKDHDVLYYM